MSTKILNISFVCRALKLKCCNFLIYQFYEVRELGWIVEHFSYYICCVIINTIRSYNFV